MLREIAAPLGVAGIERPRWTAGQLAAAVLGCEPLALIVDPPAGGDPATAEIRRLAALRAEGVPLQHLTGVAGFFGHDFLVRPGVLIPRPETERLVETAVAELARLRPGATVWEVGTGAGAIAVSVALTSGAVVGTMAASDLSPPALALAAENARRLGVRHRIRWVCSDLLNACAAGRIDLVIANLPYLPSSTLAGLPREVQHDPVLALDGGSDGLVLIRRVIEQAARALRTPGTVLLEVGAGQAEIVRREYGRAWADLAVIADETGVDRVVALRRSKGPA